MQNDIYKTPNIADIPIGTTAHLLNLEGDWVETKITENYIPYLQTWIDKKQIRIKR